MEEMSRLKWFPVACLLISTRVGQDKFKEMSTVPETEVGHTVQEDLTGVP